MPTKDVPVMVFGDTDASAVSKAEKLGLGEEWVRGDPMKAKGLDAVVSPANTLGEMSGGYDLVIRNKMGMQVQEKAMKSLAKKKMFLGQCRVIRSGYGRIPYLMIVPTVVGSLRGGSTPQKTPADVIKKATYNMMMEAYKRGIDRFATVTLGGGVGGIPKEQALKLMLEGYLKAYDEIDELIFGGRNESMDAKKGSKMDEKVSPTELKNIEKKADIALRPYNVDMDLQGKHFKDRVNDKRNDPAIEPQELRTLINKIRSNKAQKIKSKNNNDQAVLKDKKSKINIPVIIKKKKDRSGKEQTDVIAKTIMRKPDFKSSTPFIAYEETEVEEKRGNPVAKYMRKFNKATVQKDRKKAMKKGDRKHKGRYEEMSEKKFEPHMMYHPKTGEGIKAKTHQQHIDLMKKGWGHEKPSVSEAKTAHINLDDHGGARQDKVLKILKKYEKKGSIKFAGETDKGVLFDIKKPSDQTSINRELKAVGGGYHLGESTSAYGKSQSDIRRKQKHANISTSDKNKLGQLHSLMKRQGVASHMKSQKNEDAQQTDTSSHTNAAAKKPQNFVDRDGKTKTRMVPAHQDVEKENVDTASLKLKHAKEKERLRDKQSREKEMAKESMDPRDFTDKAGHVVVVTKPSGHKSIKHYANTKPAAQRYADRVNKTNKVGHKATVHKTDGRKIHEETEMRSEAMGDAKHKAAVKHITNLGKKNGMSVGQQRMHIDDFPHKHDAKTRAAAATINKNQHGGWKRGKDGKMTQEETVSEAMSAKLRNKMKELNGGELPRSSVELRKLKAKAQDELRGARAAKKSAPAKKTTTKTAKGKTHTGSSDPADRNIIMQLRKAQDVGGKHDIRVSPTGKTVKLPKDKIDALLKKHDSIQKPRDKRMFNVQLTKALRKLAK